MITDGPVGENALALDSLLRAEVAFGEGGLDGFTGSPSGYKSLYRVNMETRRRDHGVMASEFCRCFSSLGLRGLRFFFNTSLITLG